MLKRLSGGPSLAATLLVIPASGQLTWTQSPVNGHWYAGVRQPTQLSWNQADALAAQWGVHLATVTSSAEDTWLTTNILPALMAGDPSEYGPWIGGYQDTEAPSFAEPEGGWKWVTGEPWSNFGWCPMEPNDNVPSSNFLHYWQFNQLCWNDTPDQLPGPVTPWTYILETDSGDCDGNGLPDAYEAAVGTAPSCYCPGAIASTQSVRTGTPPNPAAFLPGLSPPVLGRVWDPVVDHTSFLPTADVDFLGVSPTPLNLASPWGTLLCDPATALLYTAPAPGQPFQIAVPSQCSLVGVNACTQAASFAVIGGQIQLTNALDITIGTF